MKFKTKNIQFQELVMMFQDNKFWSRRNGKHSRLGLFEILASWSKLSILITDVGDKMYWWHVRYVGDSFDHFSHKYIPNTPPKSLFYY